MGVQSSREKKRVVVVGGVLGVTHVGCVICPRCGSAEKERTRSRCEAGAAFVTPYSSSSPQAHTSQRICSQASHHALQNKKNSHGVADSASPGVAVQGLRANFRHGRSVVLVPLSFLFGSLAISYSSVKKPHIYGNELGGR